MTNEETIVTPSGSGKKKTLKRIFTILFWLLFNPIVAIAIVGYVVIMPLVDSYNATFGSESVYDNVFVAELGEKYERLYSVDEPKIAVIGGSSVAFGLDSELMSKYTGMEVINFGLYATLGSKVMLDLSEDAMNEGDIVVFAPELDNQTLSMYFGAKSMWQVVDVYPEIWNSIRPADRPAMYAAFEEYKAEKIEYLTEGYKPNPSGVYNSANFNTYGDINYPRPYNTMGMGYDPNTIFEFDQSIVEEEFIDYFNAYCQRLAKKGVKVYFSYCPVNELSVSENTTDESIKAFENYLASKLECPIISDLDDYVMDWGYFYDTNLHLNDAGIVARTNQLVCDLRDAIGNNDRFTIDIPEPPGKESGNELLEGDNSFMDYFEYELRTLPNGDIIGVSIVGVTAEGLANTKDEITIPTSNGEYLVIHVNADVLSQIPNLKSVKFGKNITSLADGLFRGCTTLTDAYLEFGPDDCSVTTPDPENPHGLMLDAPEGIKIHAKAQYEDDYRNHYTWGHYFKHFVIDEE